MGACMFSMGKPGRRVTGVTLIRRVKAFTIFRSVPSSF